MWQLHLPASQPQPKNLIMGVLWRRLVAQHSSVQLPALPVQGVHTCPECTPPSFGAYSRIQGQPASHEDSHLNATDSTSVRGKGTWAQGPAINSLLARLPPARLVVAGCPWLNRARDCICFSMTARYWVWALERAWAIGAKQDSHTGKTRAGHR